MVQVNETLIKMFFLFKGQWMLLLAQRQVAFLQTLTGFGNSCTRCWICSVSTISKPWSLSSPGLTNSVCACVRARACACLNLHRLVLWQVTECGGCLCSSTTPDRWLTASWQTSTTSANTAGMYLCSLGERLQLWTQHRTHKQLYYCENYLTICVNLLFPSIFFIFLPNIVLTESGCWYPLCCRSGGACTAAAFLREFVTAPHWAHLDIAGVMSNKDEIPYLRKGMSGRPTRTLVEFAAGLTHNGWALEHMWIWAAFLNSTSAPQRSRDKKILKCTETLIFSLGSVTHHS